jgi:hypothetical protein
MLIVYCKYIVHNFIYKNSITEADKVIVSKSLIAIYK